MTIDLKALRETAAREIRRGASGLCPPQTVIALLDRLEAAEKALAEPVVKENLTTEYDQTALELCKVCGWKAVIPTEGCLNCEREKQLMKKPPAEPVVELMNWRWFTHSEESGYQPRKTRKEAIDAASHELSEERGNANIEGEWSSNAESIVWGCVMGGVKAQQDESGSVDMRLELAAIEAPPAEPAVEPFGYFRAEPFGWTDCAPTDEGAKALYEAPPPAEPVPEFARAIERLIKGAGL